MPKNAPFLAKFRFDTAENEPRKISNSANIFQIFQNFGKFGPRRREALPGLPREVLGRQGAGVPGGRGRVARA